MSREDGPEHRFTRLHLQNWRNFRDIRVDLQARTFLVGPNASGKSNFLDALQFLHDIVANGGLKNAVQIRSGVPALRSFHGPPDADIGVHVWQGTENAPGLWEYELRFNQDSQGRPIVVEEVVRHEGEKVLERPDARDEEDPELLTQTHLEQVNVNRKFRNVAQFVKRVQYLHLVPELVRDPDRYTGDSDDPYGGDFLQQMAATDADELNDRLQRIEDALSFAVPDLTGLRLERDERTGAPHLEARFSRGSSRGKWQREEHLSDGTLRLLGLLWAVQDGWGPLLLEEPELSLHSEVVRAIPQMLARVQRTRGRQVLLSTHSPALLRDEGIGLDEVLLLIPTEEDTIVKPASSVKDAEVLLEHGSTLADIAVAETRPKETSQLGLLDWED